MIRSKGYFLLGLLSLSNFFRICNHRGRFLVPHLCANVVINNQHYYYYILLPSMHKNVEIKARVGGRGISDKFPLRSLCAYSPLLSFEFSMDLATCLFSYQFQYIAISCKLSSFLNPKDNVSIGFITSFNVTL